MDKITNVNLEEFLNDHLERSEIVLLEEGKENSDIGWYVCLVEYRCTGNSTKYFNIKIFFKRY